MKIDEISKIIDEEAPKHGVSADIFRKVVFRGENPADKEDIAENKVSLTGAFGIAQILPSTFESLKSQGKLPKDSLITDIRANLIAGMKVLREGMDINGGNVRAGVAHYNGGTAAGRAVAAGKDAPAAETRSYLQRVFMDTPPEITSTSGTPTPLRSVQVSGKYIANAEGLQESLASYLENARTSTAELQRLLTGQTTVGAEIADAELQAGGAKAKGIIATGQAAIAANNKQRLAVDSFGAGLENPHGMMQEAIRRQTEARATMDTLSAKVREESAVQPWDDPLRWVVNKFTMPNLIKAHNLANAENRAMGSRIDEAQARVRAQQQFDVAPMAMLIGEKANAEAQQAVFDALAKAKGTQMQTMHLGAQAVLQHLTISRGTLEAQTMLARLTAESYGIRVSDKESAALQTDLDRVNLKRTGLGLEPYTAIAFKMLTAKERSALMENAMLPTIGKDPGDALRFMDSQGAIAPMRDKNPVVHEFLNQIFVTPEFKNALKDVQMMPKHTQLPLMEQRALALENLAVLHAAEEGSRQKTGKGNNTFSNSSPYKLKLQNAAIQPELAANPIAQALHQQIQRGGAASIDDDFAATTVLGMAEADRSKIPELAKAYSQFYNDGIYWQWGKGGASKLGYPRPSGYLISGTHTTGKALDTGSPAAVEHWIIKNLQEQQLRKTGAILDPMSDQFANQISGIVAP